MRIVRATLFVLSALTWASGSISALERSNLVRRAQSISSDEGEALEIPLFEATQIHTEEVLAFHDMPAESGKGYTKKGKGESKSKKSKSGKKSSKKDSKKGSSKSGDYSTSAPVHPPTTASESSDDGTTRPPVPIPTRAPTPTSPTATDDSLDPPDNSIAVELSEFTLEYAVSMNREPDRGDLLELEGVTNSYIDAYMKTRYSQAPAIDLLDVRTVLITSSYASGLPIPVAFMSTAHFGQNSQLPTQDTLDDILEEAFEGTSLRDYVDVLNNLPVGNVFQTTTSVELGGSNSSGSGSTSSRLSRSGIAAAAVGLTLLSAGFILYKMRSEDNDYDDGKSFGKPIGADVTVTGDTYAGAETCDGSATAYSSRRGEDEEHGLHGGQCIDPMGLIDKAYDDSSVTPIWHPDHKQEQEYDDHAVENVNVDGDESIEGSVSDDSLKEASVASRGDKYEEIGEVIDPENVDIFTGAPVSYPQDPDGVAATGGNSVASPFSISDGDDEESESEEEADSLVPTYSADDDATEEMEGQDEEEYENESAGRSETSNGYHKSDEEYDIDQTLATDEERMVPTVGAISPAPSNDVETNSEYSDEGSEVAYEMQLHHEQPIAAVESMQDPPSLTRRDEELSPISHNSTPILPRANDDEQALQEEEDQLALPSGDLQAARRPLTVNEIENLLSTDQENVGGEGGLLRNFW